MRIRTDPRCSYYVAAMRRKQTATTLPKEESKRRIGEDTLLRLRIALPDRPGSLARVSRTLAHLGADIRTVTVLDAVGGRVVDEFTVDWPNWPGPQRLSADLAAVPGVTLEGAWQTRQKPDAFVDLDLLLHIATAPDRAIGTLTDALPAAFSADWAIALDATTARGVLAASMCAPSVAELPEIRPSRPMTFSPEPEVHLAAVPAGAWGTFYLARINGGPAFHRIELARLTRIVEVSKAIVEGRSDALRRFAETVPAGRSG